MRGKKLILIRPKTHGDFADGAKFTQGVLRIAAEAPSWNKMTDVQKESFHMIVHKLQRVVAGNPDHADHWDDIAGYATLAAERCKGK